MLRQKMACIGLLLISLNLFPISCLLALEQTTFFNQEWLKTVVSIEIIGVNDAMVPIGTGFLIQTENNHMVLVTTKHVVAEDTGQIKKNLSYRINLEGDKSTILKDDELISIGGGNWFLSDAVDIALRFIPNIKGSDILTIPQKRFLKKEYVQSGTPCFILGFPMGLRSEKYATPILRNAIVALKNTDHFVIEGFIFPGNSGGPVVYIPAHQIGGIKLHNYIGEQMLLGIVSSYLPYQDIAVSLQTKRPRIIFEENSGLTIVLPADDILKLISTEPVQALDKSLLKDNK